MMTSELENELRSVFARSAESIIVPQQARQRLLQRDYHPRTGHRRLVVSGAAAIATATAALTGLAVVPLAGTGPGGLPSAAAVGRAMLGALPSVSGDIVYEKQIGMHRGTVVIESRLWVWPAQPAAGQQVRLRNIYAQRIPPAADTRRILPSAYAQRIPAAKALTLIDDTGLAYRYPRVLFRNGFSTATGGTVRLTQVCYLRAGRCGGGEGPTTARTWSRAGFQDLIPIGSDTAEGGILNPAAIARAILTGQWRVVRHARMDGQPVIELRGEGPLAILPPCPEPVPPSSLVDNPCPARGSLLWVNARTHLPLRWIGVAGTAVVTQEDFAYLPATAANLALLRVPIPHGYPRSQESEPGAPGY